MSSNIPVGQESNSGRISFSSCSCFTASLAKTNGISEQINSFAKTVNSSQISGAPQEKRSLGNQIIFGLMKKVKRLHAFSLLSEGVTPWGVTDILSLTPLSSLVFLSDVREQT